MKRSDSKAAMRREIKRLRRALEGAIHLVEHIEQDAKTLRWPKKTRREQERANVSLWRAALRGEAVNPRIGY